MKSIHLIGNAHIDPVWLWQWQEGFAEIKATFRSALDRMKEFPHFTFTSACSAYYMWIEQVDPKMFEEIAARVREGRWCIVGGWFVQPDCNIPSGESFARHALISQRYFMEKFGKMATVGYNVDSFGHNRSIPMMLRQSRMSGYVFMRPDRREKSLPSDLFRWESADGSYVNTFRLSCYNIDGSEKRPVSKMVEDAERGDAEGCPRMVFYGVGDHGGGPTVSLLRRMREELPPRFVYSDPERFFAEQEGRALPTVREDLQFHAKGCYSAVSEIKRNNRLAENRLYEAECLSVLSNALMGGEYPAGELRSAWMRVLFNQFHDVLCGCSIREAYDDARVAHGEAIAVADRLSNLACQRISWRVDTMGGFEGDLVTEEDASALGIPMVIFNPLPYPLRTEVRIRGRYLRVTDSEGREVRTQIVRDSKTNQYKKYACLAEVELPPMGYRLYRAFTAEGYTFPTPEDSRVLPTESPLRTTETTLENRNLRLELSPESGEPISLLDKRTGRELLGGSCGLQLMDDEPNDTWAHGVSFFKDRVDTPVRGQITLTERGPLRGCLRSVQRFGDSLLTRDYFLSAEGDRVEVSAKLDFHEKFRVLKLTIPLASDSASAFCKIPFGFIERPTDGSEQVTGDWMAVCGDRVGLALATDSKHSFDVEGATLSLTVLRSCYYADHYAGETYRDGYCEFTEQGEQRFRYSIAPFGSFSQAQRQAEELQHPPTVVPETFHRGALPTAAEGVALSAENVLLTAFKRAEDGDGLILRCYEGEGRDTELTLSVLGRDYAVRIPAHAVRTYRISEGGITLTDFIE